MVTPAWSGAERRAREPSMLAGSSPYGSPEWPAGDRACCGVVTYRPPCRGPFSRVSFGAATRTEFAYFPGRKTATRGPARVRASMRRIVAAKRSTFARVPRPAGMAKSTVVRRRFATIPSWPIAAHETIAISARPSLLSSSRQLYLQAGCPTAFQRSSAHAWPSSNRRGVFRRPASHFRASRQAPFE
ncbi:hypothetical protein OKW43_007529 [Paraburkholderia sp. WC7.3g]